MKASSNVSNLLSAIQRKSLPQAPAPIAIEAAVEQPGPSAKQKARVGKAVQFWMHEEDRKILRELAAWLASQGLRPSDSLVIRASLRAAMTGPAFLEAYRQAALCDGRLKHNAQTMLTT